MKIKNSGQKKSVKLIFGNAIKTIDKSFRASAFYNFFHSYSKTEKSFKSSFIYNLFNKNSFAAKRRVFKNNFAKQCESSVLAKAISNLYAKVLSCKIRAFAVILLCFSLCSLFIGVMKYTLAYTSTPFTDENFISALLLVISIILLPVRSSIPEFSANSKILSFIINSFFVIDNKSVKEDQKAHMPSFGTLFIVGIAMGALSLVFSIKSILIFSICAFILLLFFKTPENALPFLLLITPFCDIFELCIFSLMAICAYLYKLMRGKRSFSFRHFDFLVLLFSIIIASSLYGTASKDRPSADVVIMLVFAIMYFIVRNCIKSELMAKKTFNAMSFAAAAVAVSYLLSKAILLYGQYLPFSVTVDLFVHKTFFSEIAMGEFILLLVPIIFTSFATSGTSSKKSIMFFALVLSVLSVVTTQSKGLAAALFISVLIYIAASFRSPATSLFTVVIVCTALSLFITNSGFLGNDRFFFVNDYKENLWITTSRIISDNLLSGIGFGSKNFSDVFAVYNNFSQVSLSDCYNWYIQLLAQIGIFGFLFYAYMSVQYFRIQFTLLSETRYKNVFSSLISISSVCSVFSMYVRGITSYIWTDLKVFFVFFVIIGVSTSVYYFNFDKKLVYEKGI